MCPVSATSGDSGGPLFFIRDEPYVQLGVTAAVNPPCEKGTKYVHNRFVDLRRYLPWICTITGICPLEQHAK
ncbi:hypothetical protein OESDEN_19793 [Oesophagostomum dentatum]|uniref:Peptidase S1 domain-containing protein n=1 Tax=Oesophagostomum dentatum TaxID=61180 RepID=A0A0B1SBB6_OESDE|nr:hypothetical protein OESDEN_19793 [Oesophagostomum dentatum]